METTKTDVIIVGAGPTGLSLASQLLRYNIDFVIVDQKTGITDLSKALIVQARTLEIYEQLGLAQTAIANGAIMQEVALAHDGTVNACVNLSDLGEQISPFPFILIFEQSKNERLLYDYLQHHNRDVRWQTELESLTQDHNGVTAIVKTATGETQAIAAQYLVGCDGASSPTRHFLNLPFQGSTYPRLFYVADVDMEFEENRSTVHAAFGAEAYIVMFAMQGEKHWRLVGNIPEHEGERLKQEVSYEEVEERVKTLIKRPLNITNVRWFSTYKVHTLHAEPFSNGRCFLAGDAAHVHTPAGGQGMNTGIQDAYNLAWKLAWVIRGTADASLLDTYNEERLANAKHLLQSTDRVFTAIAGEKWYIRLFRDTLLPGLASFITQFGAAKELFFRLVSETGVNYRNSSLSQHSTDHRFTVKAGDRMPYFQIDGISIYDRLRAAKFHLLVFSEKEEGDQGLQAELQHQFGDWIDLTVIPLQPSIAKLFGTQHPFQVLLRPDNYIGFISSEISLTDLQTFFDKTAIHRSSRVQQATYSR